MTTFTFSGSLQTLSGGIVSAVSAASLRVVMPETMAGLTYTVLTAGESEPSIVDISSTQFYHFEIDGVELSTLNPVTRFSMVVWGQAQLSYVIDFQVDDLRYSFAIGGDGLDVFATVEHYQAYVDSIVCNCGIEVGAYAAGQVIDLRRASGVGISENDVVTGSGQADTLNGGIGNDRLIGGLGDDWLYGGDGADTLNGGGGDDVIIGGDTAADLRDVVYGGDGHDSIDGGYGNDELRGDAGNDNIAGGFGADTVIGGDGNDVITGSAWGDEVFGGAGNDFLNGGFGHDRVNGGSGADKFYHLGIADHGSDWIQDYTALDGDVLLFGDPTASAADFQINYAYTADGAGERSGDDNVQEAFVIYRPTGQIMWALVDGAGQGEINIQIDGVVTDLLA